MEYVVDDRKLTASVFLDFVNQVWQGDYDMERTRQALSRTLNITVYDDGKLPAHSHRWLLFRDDHRAARTS